MKKAEESVIELDRVQYMMLRHRCPTIHSIARIRVVGRSSNLKALVRPINEAKKPQLISILKELFPKIKIPAVF
jgi:hypothetical protein